MIVIIILRNWIINEYNVENRRWNYILWIIVYQQEWKWVDVDSLDSEDWQEQTKDNLIEGNFDQESITQIRFWADVINQLWGEAGGIFLTYWWGEVSENPENHIDDQGRILWSQQFLHPFFKEFCESLTGDQKELFIWKVHLPSA